MKIGQQFQSLECLNPSRAFGGEWRIDLADIRRSPIQDTLRQRSPDELVYRPQRGFGIRREFFVAKRKRRAKGRTLLARAGG